MPESLCSVFPFFYLFRYYSLYLIALLFSLERQELFTLFLSVIVQEVRPNERHSKDTLKHSFIVFSLPHIRRLLATHSPHTWYDPLALPHESYARAFESVQNKDAGLGKKQDR